MARSRPTEEHAMYAVDTSYARAELAYRTDRVRTGITGRRTTRRATRATRRAR